MADSNRPRPRPRPKPVQKSIVDVNSTPTTTPGASSSSIPRPSTPKKVITQDDGDAMFMKNRNRSLKTWHKLEEINKDQAITINSGSDSDENDSPGARKRRKKARQTQKPKWQLDKERIRLLSECLSSDSDSDVVILDDDSTPNARRLAKRKRQRSRSRSITPPPAIPLHQVQNVRAIVRQALGVPAPRPPSPTADDWDDPEAVMLDPELESIALKIRAQTPLHPQSPSSVGQLAEGDVVVNVTWNPHPLNDSGKEEHWEYKISRNDNFRDLFEAIAEDACILPDSLIVCYQGNRVFSSVTPQTLKIWDEVQMVAYEKQAYAYIRAHPETSHGQFSQTNTSIPADISDNDDPPPPAGASQTQDHSDAESEVDGETLKLIFRSALTGARDITLTVRPTTKCGSIVKAFLRKAGLADQYPEVFAEGGPQPTNTSAKKGKKSKATPAPIAKDPRLCIDGEKMNNDSEIADADLEDGDLVEVVGL